MSGELWISAGLKCLGEAGFGLVLAGEAHGVLSIEPPGGDINMGLVGHVLQVRGIKQVMFHLRELQVPVTLMASPR